MVDFIVVWRHILKVIEKMPKKKKEKDIEKRPPIEEIYSHEYWLEKYNNEIKCTPKIFDNFLPNPKSKDANISAN